MPPSRHCGPNYFYLPLFKSVTKTKLFFGRKNLGGDTCPLAPCQLAPCHHCPLAPLPHPKYVYVCNASTIAWCSWYKVIQKMINYLGASPSWKISGWWWAPLKPRKAKMKLLTPTIQIHMQNVSQNFEWLKKNISSRGMKGIIMSSLTDFFFPDRNCITL